MVLGEVGGLGQLDADMQAAQRLAVGRCRLAQHLHRGLRAARDLRHHRHDRQAGEGLDLVGAAEGVVAAFAQERDRDADHHAAGDAEQGDQRLRRIGRCLGRRGRRDQLGVGREDVLGAGALLGAQQHGLEQVAVDGGVALQRLEPDGLVVDRTHLALQRLEVLGERLVAGVGGAGLAGQTIDDLGDLGVHLGLDASDLGAGIEHLRMLRAVRGLQLRGAAFGVGLLLLEGRDQRRIQHLRHALAVEAALTHLLSFPQARVSLGLRGLRGEKLAVELGQLLGGDAAAASDAGALVEVVLAAVVLDRLVGLAHLVAQLGDAAHQELVDAVHRSILSRRW